MQFIQLASVYKFCLHGKKKGGLSGQETQLERVGNLVTFLRVELTHFPSY